MAINLNKKCNKVHHSSLGAYLLEGIIKKYFYKEIIKEKFWSLRTDGRVEKNARKTSVLGGVYCKSNRKKTFFSKFSIPI